MTLGESCEFEFGAFLVFHETTIKQNRIFETFKVVQYSFTYVMIGTPSTLDTCDLRNDATRPIYSSFTSFTCSISPPIRLFTEG